MPDNLERIFDQLREVADQCVEVTIYFQGFDVAGELKAKYNYSFHREPMDARPIEVEK